MEFLRTRIAPRLQLLPTDTVDSLALKAAFQAGQEDILQKLQIEFNEQNTLKTGGA